MAAVVLLFLANLRFHPRVKAKYRPDPNSLSNFPYRERRKIPKSFRERLEWSFISLKDLKNRKIIRTKTNVKSSPLYQ
jgi:hypothetical protein